MTERHLILQELILAPSAEWIPGHTGWLMARVNEGVGYWLPQQGAARELNAGDGLIVARHSAGALRASQLGALKLQFFIVQPQHLNGLLAVTEWHQLEVAPNNLSSHASIFTANDGIGQRFTRIAHQSSGDKLTMRCALLQLWANAVAGFLPAPLPPSSVMENKLRERFRRFVGRMTEAELSERSLAELAGELHCSERHFSRLFREEFGVPLRARQIELRLQRARQLLAGTDAKIISVAYDSGYRHLGLFNTMFKKRFGMTPSEWREQNINKKPASRARGVVSRVTAGFQLLLATLGIFFSPMTFAQTDSNQPDNLPFTMDTPEFSFSTPKVVEPDALTKARGALFQKMAELDERDKHPQIHYVEETTNGPHFAVEKYLIDGNSVLAPGTIGGIFTNVPAAYGTNVSLEGIRAALGDLQMAYRERGFVTVSVGLPQQKLTGAEVKVKVTEGRLAAINVTGNRYYSSNNVMRALPSLHTNILLNSHVLQNELDAANASRDRQIYPVIGPGAEPGTSELTLKVKDRLPLHARLELNDLSTPGTPGLRAAFNAQYDNLWDLEHQFGVQYTFAFQDLKNEQNYSATPFDDPLVANYSMYYRIPIGGYMSAQQQIEDYPNRFGYNEVTRRFNLPPPTERPELNFYASRSTTDTGVQFGPRQNVITTSLLTIDSQDSGDNITVNEDVGGRLTWPVPLLAPVNSSIWAGVDFKRFQQVSYNTNNFYVTEVVTNSFGDPVTVKQTVSSGQPPLAEAINYLPLNFGWSGSVPDSSGATFFNAQLNFGIPLSSDEFSHETVPATTNHPAYTTNRTVAFDPHTTYVSAQLSADRELKMSKDWSIKLHADGQWASNPLNANEKYAMGGSQSVRGYTDGEAYGDTGWRLSIEPTTRLFSIGNFGNEGHTEPCWVRTSTFFDYGRIYALDHPGAREHLNFCGTGFALSANVGSHFDARLTVAFPLIADPMTRVGDPHVYFGIGAQF